MYDDNLFQNKFFFSSESLNWNSKFSLHLDIKIIFNLQYRKSLSIVRLSPVLKSSESLLKHGKTKVNSLLGTMKLRSFLINNLFKNVFIHKDLGIIIVFEYWLQSFNFQIKVFIISLNWNKISIKPSFCMSGTKLSKSRLDLVDDLLMPYGFWQAHTELLV